jgi:transcriptional pleiotropic regulator of transition state genes
MNIEILRSERMEKRTRRTGIVDCAGRVIIPKRFREECGFEDGTKVEFSLEDGKLIIKKASLNCAFCGELTLLTEFEDKAICASCLKKIKNL